MQGNIVKSTQMSVRLNRVLMAATAPTWLPDTTALVRQNTSAIPVQRRTAPPTIRAVTVVHATALGCAAVHLATEVV